MCQKSGPHWTAYSERPASDGEEEPVSFIYTTPHSEHGSKCLTTVGKLFLTLFKVIFYFIWKQFHNLFIHCVSKNIPTIFDCNLKTN